MYIYIYVYILDVDIVSSPFRFLNGKIIILMYGLLMVIYYSNLIVNNLYIPFINVMGKLCCCY